MSAQPVIVQQITENHLPVFSFTVKAFRAAMSAPVINWKDIGKIILKDPGLVLQTIQLLKSGSRRANSLEVTDMSQAVMLMGMDRVKNLLVGLPVLEQTLSEKSQNGYTRAVNRALHAAFQARNWSQWRNDFAPEEVYIATLLHCIPELALWVSEPDKMHELRRCVYKEGMSPDEAHHIGLGQSLQHYGRQVTSDLHLPGFVHDVLRPENAALPRVQGVLLAVQLANSVEFGWYRDEVTQLLSEIAAYLHKSEDETVRIVHQNALHVAHESPFCDATSLTVNSAVRQAASLLALIPSDDDGLVLEEFPDQPNKSVKVEVSSEKGTTVRPAGEVIIPDEVESKRPAGSVTIVSNQKQPAPANDTHASRSVASGHVVCLSPQPASFARAVKELEAGMGKLDDSQVIRIAVHGMHEGIGMHRVVFAAQTSRHPHLEARCMAGSDNDPVFNRFQIRLDKINLFSRLLEKPSGVWINDENRAKYWQGVPDEFKVLVKVNSFCALSVFAGGKPVGLFYADRFSEDCKIDKQAFTLFRHLGLLTAKCIAARAKTAK